VVVEGRQIYSGRARVTGLGWEGQRSTFNVPWRFHIGVQRSTLIFPSSFVCFSPCFSNPYNSMDLHLSCSAQIPSLRSYDFFVIHSQFPVSLDVYTCADAPGSRISTFSLNHII
jgi:hypothetical protein